MNIVNERDGLDMVCEHHVWTLYLVENGGTLYTPLATLNDYRSTELLSEYLARDPRRPGNDNRSCQTPAGGKTA